MGVSHSTAFDLTMEIIIKLLLVGGILTIPLLIGFGLGYGVREMISRRRREAARLRHINDWNRLAESSDLQKPVAVPQEEAGLPMGG